MASSRHQLPPYIMRMAGAELAGRYRILVADGKRGPRVVGEGSWGYVLEAEGPLGEGDRKAVKVLKRDFVLSDPDRASQRFQEEIAKLKLVKHPNIVSIESVGLWQDPDSGIEIPYYAMEFAGRVRPSDRFDRLEIPHRRAVPWHPPRNG